MEIHLPSIILFLIIFTSIVPVIGQTYVIDSNQTGKDIILNEPSDITKSNYKTDPQKEKIVNEKHKILVDALMAEEAQYGGFKNRAQHLPWSTIGYDNVDHALEVTILPEYFTADNMPKYFEKIRSIVGNDVDIALSPLPYPEAPVGGYDVSIIVDILVVSVIAGVGIIIFRRLKK